MIYDKKGNPNDSINIQESKKNISIISNPTLQQTQDHIPRFLCRHMAPYTASPSLETRNMTLRRNNRGRHLEFIEKELQFSAFRKDSWEFLVSWDVP